MNRVVAAFAVLAGLAADVPARAQAPTPETIQTGYRLFYEGDTGAAIKHFKDLLTATPNDLPARFGLLFAQEEWLKTHLGVVASFEKGLDELIDLADQRYGRNKQDDEALFYLAQGHFLRAEYKFDHDKGMLGAARDGARAKNLIETYVKRHPEHGDAYFVLGLYNYYVELVPSFVKMFRFLLFLPAGNRTEGLKQIERAAAQGPLFGPRAEMVLVEIYSTLEGRVAEAVAVGAKLRRRYPANDEIDFAMAELYSSASVEDYGQAAAAYQEVIDRRRVDPSLEGSTSRYRGLSGLSNVRQDQWRFDEAIAALAPPIDAGVTNPDWVLPQFLLRRANLRALLDDAAAVDDAKRVLGDARLARWHQNATSLITSIEQRRASGEAALYASLIPASRLVAEGKYDEARRLYEPIRAAHPQAPLVAYRLAYLDFAKGDSERALGEFAAIAANRAAPASIRAFSLLYVGRAHDLSGRREQARQTYQKVIDDFEKERASSSAKIGLVTPYKRPGSQ